MAGAVWMALAHPLVALGMGLVAVAVAVLLTIWLARRAIRRVRAATGGRAGRARPAWRGVPETGAA